MPSTILLKRSSTASSVPAAGSLQAGELAVNLADQKLYSKTAGGTVVQVGFGNLTSAMVTTALGFTPYNSTNPSGYITASGSISGSSGSCTGNAATATKWTTGRTIALTGDVTGTSAAFDGSAALSLAATRPWFCHLNGTCQPIPPSRYRRLHPTRSSRWSMRRTGAVRLSSGIMLRDWANL